MAKINASSSTGKLIQIDNSTKPPTVSVYDPVSKTYKEPFEINLTLDNFIKSLPSSSEFNVLGATVLNKDGREAITLLYQHNNQSFYASLDTQNQAVITPPQLISLTSPGNEIRQADDGTTVTFSSANKKFSVVLPDGTQSTIRTDNKLRDVQVITTDGGTLIWAMNKYGGVEVVALSSTGFLDTDASASMSAFFNSASDDYVAMHVAEDGRAHALDRSGYLHTFSQKDGVTGFYRSAEPVFNANALKDLYRANLTIDPNGRAELLPISKSGVASATITADATNALDNQSLSLLFGVVRVSEQKAYMLRDGVLYEKNGNANWLQLAHSGLSDLRLSSAGIASVVQGGDSVRLLNTAGVNQAVRFDINNASVSEATHYNGMTYALDSNGRLHFNGTKAGSFDASVVLKSFVVKSGKIVAVSSDGKIVSFDIPTENDSNHVANNVTEIIDNTQKTERVLLDANNRIVLLQEQLTGTNKGKVSYAAYDLENQIRTPLLDADGRGFNTIGGVGRNGIVTASDGRRYSLADGKVYYFSHASGEWNATPTDNISKLKLGADGKLYALDLDNNFLRLNDYGFVESTGEQAIVDNNKIVRYLGKALQANGHVVDFTVTPTGSILYVDQDNRLSKVDIGSEDFAVTALDKHETGRLPDMPIAPGVKINDQLQVKISATDDAGMTWLLDTEGRVFQSETPAVNDSWRQLNQPSGTATNLVLMKSGRIAVQDSEGNRRVHEGIWRTVKTPSVIALSSGHREIISLSVQNDGSIWTLNDAGDVLVKTPQGDWQSKPVAGNTFLKLKTLADGTVAGQTVDGKLYRYQSSASGHVWQQHTDVYQKPAFDVLYDQLNFSRHQVGYQVPFVGSSEAIGSARNKLSGSLRQEFPSQKRGFAAFKNWQHHFRASSTSASAGHHNDIQQAKNEINNAWFKIGLTPLKLSDQVVNADLLATFKKYQTTIDTDTDTTINKIRKELGIDDRAGNPNPDWETSNAYKQMTGFLSGRRQNTSRNAIKRLYDFRVAMFGADDSTTKKFKALLDKKVYLPVGKSALGVLVGRLINDHASLKDMSVQSSIAQIQSAHPDPEQVFTAAKLDTALEAMDTARKGSKISIIDNAKFTNLDRADRGVKTIDYLLGGFRDKDHKINRALNRQGAVQGNVVDQYTQIIQSMGVGEKLEVKAGWKLTGNLGYNLVSAEGIPGASNIGPRAFAFGGGSFALSGGGGREYKVSISKTVSGITLGVTHVGSGTFNANVSGFVGVGAGVGGTDSVVGGSVFAGATGTASYTVDGSVDSTINFTIDQDDNGKLQKVLKGLFTGTIDPYTLLQDADTSSRTTTVGGSLDFTGAAGATAQAAINAPGTSYDPSGVRFQTQFNLNIPSVSLSLNALKHSDSQAKSYTSDSGFSDNRTHQVNLLNSVGVDVSAGANFALRGQGIGSSGYELVTNQTYDAVARNGGGPTLNFGAVNYTRTWDRLGSALFPKDGFNLSYDKNALKSISWDVSIKKTSTLLDNPKVKELLDNVPSLRTQLKKLTSFTTPANSDRIKSKLAEMLVSNPSAAVQISALQRLTDFNNAEDKKNFRHLLRDLGKSHPQLSTSVSELTGFLGAKFWQTTNNKPVSISLEVTPEALAKIKRYDPVSDGDYTTFVNKVAQDAANFRVASFTVNQPHSYKSTGNLDAYLFKFASTSELALSKDQASIKVFYADGPVLDSLELSIRKLGQATSQGVSAEISTRLDNRKAALLQSIDETLGLTSLAEDNPLRTELQNKIDQLGKASDSPALQKGVDDAIKALRAVAVVDTNKTTAGNPTFTYSGDLLVQNPLEQAGAAGGFGKFVQGSADNLLLPLGNRFGSLGNSSSVTDTQNSVRQLLIDTYVYKGQESSHNASLLVDAVERDRIANILENGADNNQLQDGSLRDRVKALFEIDAGNGTLGTKTEYQALRGDLASKVTETTLTEFDRLYEQQTALLNELTESDVWRRFDDEVDLEKRTLTLKSGQLVYEKDGKSVLIPQDIARSIIRQEGISLIEAMRTGYSGTLYMREAIPASQTTTLNNLLQTKGQTNLHVGARQPIYNGIEISKMLDALRDKTLISAFLNPAQEFILKEFFATEDGRLNHQSIDRLVNSPQKLSEFKANIVKLREGSVNIAELVGLSGAQALEKVVQWGGISSEGALGFGRIVDNNSSGVSTDVRFAPQSLFVGLGADGKPHGRCVGLGLGYLYTLAQGSDTNLKDSFLDGIFTHSQVVQNNAEGGSLSATEAAQTQDFRNLVSDLHNYGNTTAGDVNSVLERKGSLTLDAAISQLSAGGDKYFQLNTGNHVLNLAKKTVNGTAQFFFYDPNVADVELSGATEVKSAAALRKIIAKHLDQTSSSNRWPGKLGNFYALDTSSGTPKFDVFEVKTDRFTDKQSFADLKSLLGTDGYKTERERLADKGKAQIDGVNISLTTLYDLGATIDGERITAKQDISNADIQKKLKFSPKYLSKYLVRQTFNMDVEDAAKLLRKRLESESSKPQNLLYGEGNDQDSYLAQESLQAIKDNVSADLKVDGNLWTKLRTITPISKTSLRLQTAAGRIDRGSQAFGYVQSLLGVLNYIRRRNSSELTSEQKKDLDIDLGLNLGGLAFEFTQGFIEKGVVKVGSKIASVFSKATSKLGKLASGLGRGLTKFAGPVLNFLSVGLDVYGAVSAFTKLGTTKNEDQRQDLIVNGSLAVVGAVVGVVTAIAGLIFAATAAAGPLAIVGAVVGGLLALGGAIYSAVRQIESIKKHIQLTPLEELRNGWLAFWGADLDADVINRTTKVKSEIAFRKEYDKLLPEQSLELLLNDLSRDGISEIIFSEGRVQLKENYHQKIMVTGDFVTAVHQNGFRERERRTELVEKGLQIPKASERLSYHTEKETLPKGSFPGAINLTYFLVNDETTYDEPEGLKSIDDSVNALTGNFGKIGVYDDSEEQNKTGETDARVEVLSKSSKLATLVNPNIFPPRSVIALSGGDPEDNLKYPTLIGDFNGDGHNDLARVMLERLVIADGIGGGKFAAPRLDSRGISRKVDRIFGEPLADWHGVDEHPYLAGDVNGDGRDDLVKITNTGAITHLGQTNGRFNSVFTNLPIATEDGFLNQNKFTRLLGDFDGDGRQDIVAFGNKTSVFYGKADGTFTAGVSFGEAFGSKHGWQQKYYKRMVGDVDGDGKDDIVGISASNIQIAAGKARGGAPLMGTRGVVTGADWAFYESLPSNRVHLTDINHDGKADLVGINSDGTYDVLKGKSGASGPEFRAKEHYAGNNNRVSADTDKIIGFHDTDGDGKDELLALHKKGEVTSYLLGVTETKDRTAFFNLGGGNDVAVGYNDRKNLFAVFEGNKRFTGGKLDDTFLLMGDAAPSTAGTLTGGEGMDMLIAQGKNADDKGYSIDLANGTVGYRGGDKIANVSSVENATGHSETGDHLRGNDEANVLDGGGSLWGGATGPLSDLLFGNGGDDTLIVRGGTFADGGAGNDTYRVIKKAGSDVLISIQDTSDLKDQNAIILDFGVEDIKTPRLDSKDPRHLLMDLSNGDGTTTTLRLAYFYDKTTDGSMRRKSQYTFYTKDGFLLIPQWQKTLNALPSNNGVEALESGFVGRYLPSIDATLTPTFGNSKGEITATFDLSEGNGNSRLTLSNVNTGGANGTTKTVNLPDSVKLLAEGTVFNDVINGDSDNNILRGYRGQDQLTGAGGQDTYVVNINSDELNTLSIKPEDFTKSDHGEKVIVNFDQARTVTDSEGNSKQEFDNDILLFQLQRRFIGIRQDGQDAVLFYTGTGGEARAATVRLKNFFQNESHRHISLMDATGTLFEMGVDEAGKPYIANDGQLAGDTDENNLNDDLVAPWVEASVYGQRGNDRLRAKSNDGVVGDKLFGGSGLDTLVDSAGADALYGGDGEDIISVSKGRDSIVGGNGQDDIRFTSDAEGIKIVDSSATDESTDTVWLPFDISKANYAREADHLVVQGQAPNAPSGKLLSVVFYNYFSSAELRRIELKGYDSGQAAHDVTYGGMRLNEAGNDGHFINDQAVLAGLSNLTVEQRFRATKQTLASGKYVPLFSYANSSFDNEFLIGVSSGGVDITLKGTEYKASSVTAAEILDGKEHTVSVSWNSITGTLDLYLDGKIRQSWSNVKTGEKIATGSGFLSIGQEQDSQGNNFDANQTFDGVLEDVRVYSQALDANQILANRNTVLSSGLHAHWNFNDFDNAYDRVSDVSNNTYALKFKRVTGTGFTESKHPSRVAEALPETGYMDQARLWEAAKLGAIKGQLLEDGSTTKLAVPTEDDDVLILEDWQFNFGQLDHIDALDGHDVIIDEGTRSHTIKGGAGNDRIFGQQGVDKIYGDDGQDALYGGAGNDELFGGNGHDQLTDYFGVNKLSGGSGNDLLSGRGLLEGGAGSDVIKGSEFTDDIRAAGGFDTDTVSDVNYLYGFGGNDSVAGNVGTDYLYGGKGNDNLYGGEGNDVYTYAVGDGHDYISDSQGDHDRLSLISNGQAVTSDQVWFRLNGHSLEIELRRPQLQTTGGASVSTEQILKVNNWLGRGQLETIQLNTDSSEQFSISAVNVNLLIQTMAAHNQSPSAATQTAVTNDVNRYWQAVTSSAV